MGPVEVWCTITLTGSACAAPDIALVDALARLALVAGRNGGSLTVTEMSPAVARLLDLAGLLGEVGGQPEDREDVLDVEEGVEATDPPV